MKAQIGKGIYQTSQSGKKYPVSIICKATGRVIECFEVYGSQQTAKNVAEKRIKALLLLA